MYVATVTPVSRGRRTHLLGPTHLLAGRVWDDGRMRHVSICGLTLPGGRTLTASVRPSDRPTCGDCFPQ